jgi:hypothetical protein
MKEKKQTQKIARILNVLEMGKKYERNANNFKLGILQIPRACQILLAIDSHQKHWQTANENSISIPLYMDLHAFCAIL